jgi:hypothetical protein
MSVKVTQPRFATLTKLTEGLLSVLSVRQLGVSEIHSPYRASEEGRSIALTDSPRDASPLARLKQLASEPNLGGEISETPVRVTDKADRRPEVERESNVVKLHAPRLNTHDPGLLAAGWHAKARCGKTIWKRPETGFYYSEEIARCVSQTGTA